MKEDTIMDMDQVREYMLKNNPEIAPSAEAFDTKVVKKCNEICRLLFESVKDMATVLRSVIKFWDIEKYK